MQKRQLTFLVAPSLHQALNRLPSTTTATVSKALNTATNQRLLAAFEARFHRPLEVNSEKVGVRVDFDTMAKLGALTAQTKLSGEEVIRLSLEALMLA